MTDLERTYYSNMLQHHGILGMRWGKKNGPPYPLDASDHSASEKRAGWRKSLDKPTVTKHTKSRGSAKQQKNSDNEKQGLTDKQKRAIKIGAVAVGTALAAYGMYKLKKSGKLDSLIDAGKAKVDELFGKGKAGNADIIGQWKVVDLPKPSKLVNSFGEEIKTLGHAESLSDTLRKVNPLGSSEAGDNNCTYCSIASFLRQSNQHLDVVARGTGGQRQHLDAILRDCFKKVDIMTDPTECFGNTKEKAAQNMVKQFGNNASGVCAVGIKGSPGGHAFNWKIENGTVAFFDGQKGVGDDFISKVYFNMMDLSKEFVLARLDNCEVDLDGITTYVK